MSVTLPTRLPLADPPESTAALDELVTRLSAAAFRLGVLDGHLVAPAATAPGWLGQDAAAAAAQIATLAGIVGGAHAALTGAIDRLERHAALLADVRRRIAGLRTEQEEDFAVAGARLRAAVAAGSPTGALTQAVVAAEQLAAHEARRQREHAVLLAEIADDASESARVLAGCSGVVGGTGRPGDADRVMARLAAQLPGWGDQELALRGAAVASALSGPVTTAELDRLAGEAAVFAAGPAFAGALLRSLGVDGVQFLLAVVGSGSSGRSTPLARLLAVALGSARPTGVEGDPVAEVLDARYVAPDDPDGAADVVVVGMVAVLVAGVALPGGGPGARTVADWGVQILRREVAQGASAAEREPAAGGSVDPVSLVVGLLADRQDAGAAARLLAVPDSWPVLLARSWDDGGAALGRLTGLAGADAGPDGGLALRRALEALGAGVSPRDPGWWTVDRATAAGVAPALAAALGARLGEVVPTLRAAGEGSVLSAVDDSALRGLGYLTVDDRAAETLLGALRGWGAAAEGEAAAQVPSTIGAYVAAEEYGQRLAYALQGAANRQAALDRSLLVTLAESPLSIMNPFRLRDWLVCGLETGGEIGAEGALHVDGAWVNGPDTGRTFTGADAAAALPPVPAESAAEAEASFRRAMEALGVPLPPVAHPLVWWEQVLRRMPVVGTAVSLAGPPVR